jgi:PIN domain nuclease of toxin-antitoxin system
MPKGEPPAGILLDTHALVHYVGGAPLAPKAVRAIERAEERDALFVSAISLWELVMLDGAGRVKLRPTVREWWSATRETNRITVCEVTGDIAMRAGQFGGLHGDPADRLILATAYERGLALATADTKLAPYAPKAGVPVVAC